MKKEIILLVFTVILTNAFCQKTLELDSAGVKLKEFYLNQHVEKLWIKGHHVNWETGEPDKPNATKGIKTHCSAFVASVCKQKNIYILRPPEHNMVFLSNAQYDWLLTEEALKKSWHQIKDSVFVKAQKLANTGFMVVAVYKNPNPKKPGHIAFIIPTKKTLEDLYDEGPSLIQAGRINGSNISFKEGFNHHLTNWAAATKEVIFFYNENR